ncbi:MAG TPA: nucleotide exchange factor GrpE [Solirubrobacteraceae bacterium]|nr:nucleotide exchange factor GrpE [Solirubrobacteraceae bacterium]
MKGARHLGLYGWIIGRRAIERLACEIDALARRRLGGGGAPPQSSEVLACLLSARSLLEAYRPPQPEAAAPAAAAREMPWPEAAAPSPTAARLIELRDALLVSRRAGTAQAGELLDGLDIEIGATLELEGIHTLDANGRFDPEHQCAVDTWQTDVREQDDTICRTVRPGYLVGGTLLRPQDVVVYAYHPEGRQ